MEISYSEIKNMQSRVFAQMLKIRKMLKLNKNFGTFMIFLAISIGFWFLQALKDTTSVTLSYKLKIVNVPKELIFTSDIPENIIVNISGRGYSILEYLWNNNVGEVQVNFDDLYHSTQKVTADASFVRRLFTKKMGSAVKFNSSVPASFDLYYTKGIAKRVPVVFDGTYSVNKNYIFCGTTVVPDSVDIYAPREMYDSIHFVTTEHVTYSNLSSTVKSKLKVNTRPGVKAIPDSISLNLQVDLMTEKTVDVPIFCENIPKNKVLRTFPATAHVVFQVSTNDFKNVSGDQFIVVVDYNSINPSVKTCELKLCGQPDNVQHARITTQNVDFVIEQAEDY